MTVLYNENDPFCVEWLKALMAGGHIAQGVIDSRSIADVQPEELREFSTVHLFAGIGGWSLAFRLAGLPDDFPAWTGSCPCQPFSAAGKRKGTADARHLWPDMRRLVAKCRPPRVLGEQVASKDGRLWLAGVRADLEALGYGIGAADLCAAGVGAPHIRQRLYWCADRLADAQRNTGDTRRPSNEPAESDGAPPAGPCLELGRRSNPRGLADAVCDRSRRTAGTNIGPQCSTAGAWSEHRNVDDAICASANGERVGDTDDAGPQGRRLDTGEHTDQRTPWSASVLIPCADGKQRRVPANEAGQPEPSLFPLAHGVPNRVGTLRGSGNAIVPALAAEFIQAALDDFQIGVA